MFVLLEKTRKEFDADITIWMDTIESGRYDDTNKIFEEPEDCDFRVEGYMSDEAIIEFANVLKEKYNV